MRALKTALTAAGAAKRRQKQRTHNLLVQRANNLLEQRANNEPVAPTGHSVDNGDDDDNGADEIRQAEEAILMQVCA